MKIHCIWEHNGNDSLIYSDDYIGAFTRGKSRDIALNKMADEITAYQKWCGEFVAETFDMEIIQEKNSELNICDADSDVLFETEKKELSIVEYEKLKALALKSAGDFLKLYESIPNKDESCLPVRQTFYGQVPRTAFEMYEHTKNVNSYYFGEVGVDVDNEGTIFECRKRGFELLEKQTGFLNNAVLEGSYGEAWSVRKVLRRFIWHDRIHAKAMYRMAVKTFGLENIPNIFYFDTI